MTRRTNHILVGLLAALAAVSAAGDSTRQDAQHSPPDPNLSSAECRAVRERCTERMEAVYRLATALERPSATEFADPRLRQRLDAWERAAAELTARESSGAVTRDDLRRFEEAYASAYALARWIRLRMLGVERLLLVRRSPLQSGHVYEYHTPEYSPGGGPGGGIYAYEPGADGYGLRKITDAEDGLIVRCDLSFDGQEIVFNWLRNGEHFQVYRVRTDGSGLKQLTTGDHDSYDAIWLPDGDVAFVSNRDRQWALCFWSPMGVLYRMDRDGGRQTRISANYLQDFTPKLTSDGRIMFSRWEYVDRPVQPIKSIWTMNPDGSMMLGHNGNRALSPKSLLDAQTIPGTQRVISAFAGHLGWISGGLTTVDPGRGDNTQAALRNLTPDCDIGRVDEYRLGHDSVGLYETPYPVDEEHYLFSHGGTVMLRDFAGEEEWQIIDAQDGYGFYSARPLRARPRPPVRSSAPAPQEADWATVMIQDVYEGLAPHVRRGDVRQICVVEELAKAGPQHNFRQRDLDNHQFTIISGHGTFAAKKVWGYMDVAEDGSAYSRVPTNVPIYFMVIDAEGRAVQRMRSWTQFQPGETRGCVGCHEPRMMAPRGGRQPEALAAEPQELKPPEWGLDGFSYPRLIQPVWDRYCVSCHDGEKEPRSVDLRDTKTTYFSASYDLLVPWRWARDPAAYREKHGRDPYVNWIPTSSSSGSERHVRELEPGRWGSPRSRLAELILSGHPDKDGEPRFEMDEVNRRRILAWIDLNVPFYGSYSEPEYLDAAMEQEREELRRVVNGWSETRTFGARGPYGSFQGEMVVDLARASLGQEELAWLTQPVPEDVPADGTHTFKWAAVLGWLSQPPADFRLFLGDEELLTFGVVQEGTTWQNADGTIVLHFVPLSEESDGADRSGFMELTLPARMLTPGDRVPLRVAAPQTGSGRWFGVYHYP